jgi:hypothetical protein
MYGAPLPPIDQPAAPCTTLACICKTEDANIHANDALPELLFGFRAGVVRGADGRLVVTWHTHEGLGPIDEAAIQAWFLANTSELEAYKMNDEEASDIFLFFRLTVQNLFAVRGRQTARPAATMSGAPPEASNSAVRDPPTPGTAPRPARPTTPAPTPGTSPAQHVGASSGTSLQALVQHEEQRRVSVPSGSPRSKRYFPPCVQRPAPPPFSHTPKRDREFAGTRRVGEGCQGGGRGRGR